MASLGKRVALCLLQFCLDKGFFDPNKVLHDFIQFFGCSPLTIVSFVVDYYHPTTGRVMKVAVVIIPLISLLVHVHILVLAHGAMLDECFSG